jgi:hypothetical protein
MKEIIEKKGMIEDNEKQYIPDDCQLMRGVERRLGGQNP